MRSQPEQEPGPWSTRAESPWELSTGPAEEGHGEGSLQVGSRVLWEDRPPLEGHAGLEIPGTALSSGGSEGTGKWIGNRRAGVELKDRTGDAWSGRRLSAHSEVQGARNQSPVRQKGEEEKGLRLDPS